MRVCSFAASILKKGSSAGRGEWRAGLIRLPAGPLLKRQPLCPTELRVHR
jgi:hypothetical protein